MSKIKLKKKNILPYEYILNYYLLSKSYDFCLIIFNDYSKN